MVCVHVKHDTELCYFSASRGPFVFDDMVSGQARLGEQARFQGGSRAGKHRRSRRHYENAYAPERDVRANENPLSIVQASVSHSLFHLKRASMFCSYIDIEILFAIKCELQPNGETVRSARLDRALPRGSLRTIVCSGSVPFKHDGEKEWGGSAASLVSVWLNFGSELVS